MKKYWENWKELEDVRKDFADSHYDYAKKEEVIPPIDGFPTDEEMIFAWYGYGNYDGSAFVLFERDGKLYEVNSGHCSCNGLEGTWSPEETTPEALAMRDWSYRVEDKDALAALKAYIQSKVAATTV